MIWKSLLGRKLRIFFLCILLIPVTLILADGQDAAVILYEQSGYRGESITITTETPILEEQWNDRVSSLIILNGYWTFYDGANYEGKNVTLGPGNYQSVTDVGIGNNTLSSLKPR